MSTKIRVITLVFLYMNWCDSSLFLLTTKVVHDSLDCPFTGGIMNGNTANEDGAFPEERERVLDEARAEEELLDQMRQRHEEIETDTDINVGEDINGEEGTEKEFEEFAPVDWDVPQQAEDDGMRLRWCSVHLLSMSEVISFMNRDTNVYVEHAKVVPAFKEGGYYLIYQAWVNTLNDGDSSD